MSKKLSNKRIASQKIMTVIAASCLLASCASATYQSTLQAGKDADKEATRLNQLAQAPLPKADTSAIQVHDGVYLGTEAIKTHGGRTLPAQFDDAGVRLVAAAPLDITALGELITQATSIPVSFAPDVFATAGAGRPGAGSSPAASHGTASALAAALNAASSGPGPVADGGPAAPMLFADGATSTSRKKMHVNYKGSLSNFLNLAAAYFDISWAYRDGRIQFERNVTRTFTLVTMPTVISADASVNAALSGSGGGSGGSGGGGGGSGGGSSGDSSGGSSGGGGLTAGASQDASMTIALDFWADLQKTLTTILAGSGTFSAATSMSTVTVTAPPSVINRVSDYIASVNKQLLRQVTVQVQIYAVNVTANSDWQFALTAALKGGPAGTSASLGAVGMSPLPSPVQVVNLTIPGGSSAVLSALDTLGNTSTVTSAAVTTMSGQPVPLQVGNTRGYVSGVGSTTGGLTSSSSSQTSSLTTGFSLTVLPKVLDDGNVLLQYSVNLSAPAGIGANGMDLVPDGMGGSLLLPDVNQRSFIQEGLIQNGQTLVLAGFESVSDKASDQGIGNPNMKLLGGTRQGDQSRQVLVICITPVVLDHSAASAGYN